jgi:hypothetical protein
LNDGLTKALKNVPVLLRDVCRAHFPPPPQSKFHTFSPNQIESEKSAHAFLQKSINLQVTAFLDGLADATHQSAVRFLTKFVIVEVEVHQVRVCSILHLKSDATIVQIRHGDAFYNAGFLFIRCFRRTVSSDPRRWPAA